MTSPPVNLTPLQKDYAVYLPAISSFYSTYVAKQRLEKFIPDDRIPAPPASVNHGDLQAFRHPGLRLQWQPGK